MKSIILSLLLILNGSLSFSQGINLWSESTNTESSFIENKGQFDGRTWLPEKVEFGYNHNPFYVFFTKRGLTYRFDKIIRNPNRDKQNPNSPKRTNVSELVHATWLGANKDVEVVAEELIDNYFSYAIREGKYGAKNITNIKGYKKVTYKNLYDFVDVEYILHPDGGIKYAVILHPGSNPAEVQLKYSFSNTDVASEEIKMELATNGNIEFTTSLGEIVEHAPFTYSESSKQVILSSYSLIDNILSFNLGNYNSNETIIIDPWIESPTYSTSTAAWEVETDGSGNVYSIGGETPMSLKKYNSAGALQWTYVTPWDTAGVWLGTLATDNAGTSYITSGTTPEIERINNAGGMVWHNSNGGFSVEYWSITFNCDKTKLIVGGTGATGIFGPFESRIYDIDVNNGNVSSQTVVSSQNGGFGATPVEVRSISSSVNAKYIYLTHKDVGAINQNIGNCPNEVPVYELNNTQNLAYKCENYLPATQNGGGLKALISNDNYFYTHAGDIIIQWDLFSGAQIGSAPIPGGVGNTVFGGGIVVENSGLAVDDCGSVYAGSINQVHKFDQNLNLLSTSITSFTVYDVSVNSNGEVIACGAQSDNGATNRNGRIESIAMSACAQYTLICCDAYVCPADTVCETYPSFSLTPNTPGGTWSGTGVDAVTGVFTPSLAGPGVHVITYTMPCGSEDVTVVVSSCTSLTACLESNGDVTVSGGDGNYTWQETTNVTVNPSNEVECTTCGGTWDPGFPPFLPASCDVASCSVSALTTFATNATNAPGVNFPLYIFDGSGSDLTLIDLTGLTSCSSTCTPPVLSNTTIDVSCQGGNDGAIDLTITGTSTYDISWLNGPITEDISSLTAGSYTVTVVDQVDASCTETGTIIINDGVAGPTATISGGGAICAGGNSSFQVDFTGSPNWSFDYTIDGVAQPTNSGNTTSPQIITTNTAGTYVLTAVTDAGGCPGSVSGTAIITINVADDASFTTTDFCENVGNTATVTGLTGGVFTFNPVPIDGATINASTGEVTNGVGGTTYTLEYTTNGPCPSTTTQAVSVITASNTVEAISACENSTVTYPDGSQEVIIANTSHTSNLFAITGCDSIIVTNITMIPSTNEVDDVTVCSGSNYTYPDGTISNNIIVNESQTSTITSVNGCDSVIITNITIGTAFTITNDFQICSGTNFTYADGTTSTNIIINETYVSTIATPSGCDSVITENLFVNLLYAISENISICENDQVIYPDGTQETITANTTHISSLVTVAGCDSIITTNVTMNPAYNLNENISACENSNVTFPDGTQEVIIANTTHTSVLVATSGCDSTIITNVTMTQSTNTTENISVCEGDDYTYPDGTISSNILVDESYVSTFIAASGCDSLITTNITVSAAPPANAGADQTLCGSQTVTLSANDTQGNTIVWDNGVIDGVAFTPLATQTYTLTVTNATGCVSTDDVTITVSGSALVDFSGNNLIGCSPLEVEFTNLSTGGPFTDCVWDFGDGNTSTTCGTVTHTYNSPGIYTVELTVALAAGCSATGVMVNYIEVVSNPIAEFTASSYELDVFDTEVSFTNTSTNATSYIWDFGDGSGNETTTDPTHTYPETDAGYVVTLIASNEYGCTDTAQMVIQVSDVLVYYVPNAFTPDGDEFNNVFKPIFTSGYDPYDYTLLIFNRWGEVIFESHDVVFGWDGTYNGKMVQNGTYTWKLEFKETMTDKRHSVAGHVNMVK